MELINNGRLNIKKKSLVGWLVFFILFMPFAFATLHEFLGLPKFIYYFVDVALIACGLVLVAQRHIKLNKKLLPIVLFIIAFFLYTLIVYLFNYQNLFYYLWGLRNNFRFYIAFLVFAVCLNEDEAKNYLDAYDVLFWINAVVCVVQYFLLGKEQDYLGGIFGVEKGCNGYLNLFLCIIVAKTLIKFVNKSEKAALCFSKCAVALFIAVLSELKFFFIQFAIIVFLVILVTAFSWRKFIIVLLSAVGVSAAIWLLAVAFPHTVGLFTMESLLDSGMSGEGYTGMGDLNRLNAIPTLSQNILTDNAQKLFGLGLGNCDTSTYDFLNSEFYVQYSYLHYSWFHSAFLLLETGYVGLIIFIVFYIIVFFKSRKIKNNGGADKEICQLAMVTAAMSCVVALLYNASLRVECGYMFYFVMALPFINRLENKNE